MVDIADEEKSEDSAKDTKASPKKFPTKWVIVGVLLIFLGGGAYAGWKFFLAGRLFQRHDQQIASTEKTSPKSKMSNPSVAIIHEIAPFIVNLLDHSGKRYLRTKIELEIENENVKEELVRRTPQLRDAVLLLLTSKSFEDISSPQGKIQLKNELIARINQILQGGAIRTLYFTEFVVQ